MKKWLNQCVEEEIFEEVPEGEAVTCCSPLLIQPKPKFNAVDEEKLEPHMIRASVSLRVPNQFMERNRITQGPIVEDFMYKLISLLYCFRQIWHPAGAPPTPTRSRVQKNCHFWHPVGEHATKTSVLWSKSVSLIKLPNIWRYTKMPQPTG